MAAKVVSGCMVCQSLMKHVPLSQVSSGRGVGEEGVGGRSSGVKDNRIKRAVCTHYTVTRHSHFFLSLPLFLSSLSPLTVVDRRRCYWGPDHWHIRFQPNSPPTTTTTTSWLWNSLYSPPWDTWILPLHSWPVWILRRPLFSSSYLVYLCPLTPYSHDGLSKSCPSVGSKSWTQSPPLWIRGSDRASNLENSLTPPFLHYLFPPSLSSLDGSLAKLPTVDMDGRTDQSPAWMIIFWTSFPLLFSHGTIRVVSSERWERDIAAIICVAYTWNHGDILHVIAQYNFFLVSSNFGHFCSLLEFFLVHIFTDKQQYLFVLSHRP